MLSVFGRLECLASIFSAPALLAWETSLFSLPRCTLQGFKSVRDSQT